MAQDIRSSSLQQLIEDTAQSQTIKDRQKAQAVLDNHVQQSESEDREAFLLRKLQTAADAAMRSPNAESWNAWNYVATKQALEHEALASQNAAAREKSAQEKAIKIAQANALTDRLLRKHQQEQRLCQQMGRAELALQIGVGVTRAAYNWYENKQIADAEAKIQKEINIKNGYIGSDRHNRRFAILQSNRVCNIDAFHAQDKADSSIQHLISNELKKKRDENDRLYKTEILDSYKCNQIYHVETFHDFAHFFIQKAMACNNLGETELVHHFSNLCSSLIKAQQQFTSLVEDQKSSWGIYGFMHKLGKAINKEKNRQLIAEIKTTLHEATSSLAQALLININRAVEHERLFLNDAPRIFNLLSKRSRGGYQQAIFLLSKNLEPLGDYQILNYLQGTLVLEDNEATVFGPTAGEIEHTSNKAPELYRPMHTIINNALKQAYAQLLEQNHLTVKKDILLQIQTTQLYQNIIGGNADFELSPERTRAIQQTLENTRASTTCFADPIDLPACYGDIAYKFSYQVGSPIQHLINHELKKSLAAIANTYKSETAEAYEINKNLHVENLNEVVCQFLRTAQILNDQVNITEACQLSDLCSHLVKVQPLYAELIKKQNYGFWGTLGKSTTFLFKSIDQAQKFINKISAVINDPSNRPTISEIRKTLDEASTSLAGALVKNLMESTQLITNFRQRAPEICNLMNQLDETGAIRAASLLNKSFELGDAGSLKFEEILKLEIEIAKKAGNKAMLSPEMYRPVSKMLQDAYQKTYDQIVAKQPQVQPQPAQASTSQSQPMQPACPAPQTPYELARPQVVQEPLPESPTFGMERLLVTTQDGQCLSLEKLTNFTDACSHMSEAMRSEYGTHPLLGPIIQKVQKLNEWAFKLQKEGKPKEALLCTKQAQTIMEKGLRFLSSTAQHCAANTIVRLNNPADVVIGAVTAPVTAPLHIAQALTKLVAYGIELEAAEEAQSHYELSGQEHKPSQDIIDRHEADARQFFEQLSKITSDDAAQFIGTGISNIGLDLGVWCGAGKAARTFSRATSGLNAAAKPFACATAVTEAEIGAASRAVKQHPKVPSKTKSWSDVVKNKKSSATSGIPPAPTARAISPVRRLIAPRATSPLRKLNPSAPVFIPGGSATTIEHLTMDAALHSNPTVAPAWSRLTNGTFTAMDVATLEFEYAESQFAETLKPLLAEAKTTVAGTSKYQTPVPHASTPVGRRGQKGDIDVKQMNFKPTVIYGRNYCTHAIEQINYRGITPMAVENAILHGKASPNKILTRMTHYDPVNNISVITEIADGTVVTVSSGIIGK